MVVLQLLDDGPEFGVLTGQCREGSAVLPGVVPDECRAEGQTVCPQLPRPFAPAVEPGVGVLAELLELLAEREMNAVS